MGAFPPYCGCEAWGGYIVSRGLCWLYKGLCQADGQEGHPRALLQGSSPGHQVLGHLSRKGDFSIQLLKVWGHVRQAVLQPWEAGSRFTRSWAPSDCKEWGHGDRFWKVLGARCRTQV